MNFMERRPHQQARKNSTLLLVCFIDFAKAYDSVYCDGHSVVRAPSVYSWILVRFRASGLWVFDVS